MANRSERARIAAETLAITQGARYRTAGGVEVDLRAALDAAVQATTLVRPADLPSLRQCAEAEASRRSFTTRFEVRNETTFAAARRLVETFGPQRVAALNFASARSPGGGFLSGAQAQEEALARASGLYPCLLQQMEYYEVNRRASSSLYTDHLIVSPRVPVFRDDDDALIERPWEVTVITSPAPNAGAVIANQPHRVGEIELTLRRRMEAILSAAIVHQQTALVLGAWGCGVFRNDPAVVANLFGEFLLPGGVFANAFDQIAFAILDRGTETIGAFSAAFNVTK